MRRVLAAIGAATAMLAILAALAWMRPPTAQRQVAKPQVVVVRLPNGATRTLVLPAHATTQTSPGASTGPAASAQPVAVVGHAPQATTRTS